MSRLPHVGRVVGKIHHRMGFGDLKTRNYLASMETRTRRALKRLDHSGVKQRDIEGLDRGGLYFSIGS